MTKVWGNHMTRNKKKRKIYKNWKDRTEQAKKIEKDGEIVCNTNVGR